MKENNFNRKRKLLFFILQKNLARKKEKKKNHIEIMKSRKLRFERAKNTLAPRVALSRTTVVTQFTKLQKTNLFIFWLRTSRKLQQ